VGYCEFGEGVGFTTGVLVVAGVAAIACDDVVTAAFACDVVAAFAGDDVTAAFACDVVTAFEGEACAVAAPCDTAPLAQW